MGLILDTSTLVTAERRGHNVREIFAQLRATHGEVETGLAAVTVVELAHGIERAKLDTQRQRRQAFLDDLIADMTIHPLTAEIARLAGKLSGQEAERGITLPFEDLLIGADRPTSWLRGGHGERSTLRNDSESRGETTLEKYSGPPCRRVPVE